MLFNDSKSVFKSRKLAKETRQSFISYFSENFPSVRNLKVRIDPYNCQVIASAKLGSRRLYARDWNVEKCFKHFIFEYQQKVLIEG